MGADMTNIKALPQAVVVGTAGHIDHGKTSMIRTLTGFDLDRLPEEQERGITIALGFTTMALAGGKVVSFVDVPGHERLVRTMVAGAAGIDAVLLCVSAQDGVMPQTKEHIAILKLLGVEQGAVVLTMADLVDEDFLELATDDVKSAVTGTFLEGSPIVPFSSVTGAGVESLKEVLLEFKGQARSLSDAFRLPVDRTFVQPGFGTIATGTTWSGRLKVDSNVTLMPEGKEVRVRGIQVHGAPVSEAQAGYRTALNLAGVEKEEVPRGTVVVSGTVPCSHILDIRYTHLAESDLLEDGTAVRLLLGTSECMGRLYIAEKSDVFTPGKVHWAQLRLESPIPCLKGDRFVIRRSSPLETLGGGDVVDPWAKRMRKKNREAYGNEIERLYDGDHTVWLDRAGLEGLDKQEWEARAGGAVSADALESRVFSKPSLEGLQRAMEDNVRDFHVRNPLCKGANRRDLLRGAVGHLEPRTFDALLEQLSQSGALVLDDALVRHREFSVVLTKEQVRTCEDISKALSQVGIEGLAELQLVEIVRTDEVIALTRYLESEGEAYWVPKMGWIGEMCTVSS
jgi:selenocysteine-specific elongation factor